MRRARPSLAFTALALAASAFGAPDPFETAAMTPPRPQLALADGTSLPCRPFAPGTSIGVLEVVDQALCRNPKTVELWANARNQAALVGLATAPFLPNLNAGAGIGRYRSNGETSVQGNAALTLSWLLLDFGTRTANLENARQLLAAAAATLDATVQSVFLNALQAYYNAQAARAALAAAQDAEKAAQESLTAAATRQRVGVATPADRLQAQTAWSQAVLNRIRAEGTLKTLDGVLANAMGMDADTPLKLAAIPHTKPDADFERDIEALIATARARRPDLQAAEAQLRAAQANIDAARGAGLPTLSLAAGPSWQRTSGGGNDFTGHANAIGLTLNVPIFSGFDTTYRVRAAEAKRDAAGAQRDGLRLQIALDVWSAYQSLITATQAMRSSDDLLLSAEQSERVALGRYKAGVGTILDLLNAQSALTAARLQRIQATLDWRVSRAALARAIGTLDNRLLHPDAH